MPGHPSTLTYRPPADLIRNPVVILQVGAQSVEYPVVALREADINAIADAVCERLVAAIRGTFAGHE